VLEPRHILQLKLDSERLQLYREMPPPGHASKKLTGQIVAIGNATISELLHIEPDVFSTQLAAARDFGASYLTEDSQNNIIGISAATSLIRGDSKILNKNLILPKAAAYKDPHLAAHYIISVFLRGSVRDGGLPDVSEVNVAGWADTKCIQNYGRRPPETFKSKLDVVALPCTALQPIDTLLTQLNMDKFCV